MPIYRAFRTILALAFAVLPAAPQTRTPKGDWSKFTPQVREQVAALYSENAAERANAAYRLGRARAVAAVPYLAGLLGDVHKVRPEYRSSPLSGAPLALVGVGEVAAQALGDLNALPALLQAIHDPDDSIAQDAAAGLVWPPDVHRLDSVLPLLSDPDARVRARAAGVISQLGKREVPLITATAALLAALKDDAAEVRLAAAGALLEAADARATEALIALARDPNPELRRLAIKTATEQKGATALAAIVGAVSDPDREVRLRATRALIDRKAPQAGEALVKALGDSDPQVRKNAAAALGKLREPRAVEPLVAALKDPDLSIRESAIEALGACGDARAAPGLLELAGERSRAGRAAASALVKLGTPGVDALLAALRGDSTTRREQAVWNAGRLVNDPRWISALIAAFQFQDVDSALRAALSGRQTAAEPALTALSDQNAAVRSAAAWVLGSLKHRPAVPALIAALADSAPEVRASAASALRLISGQDFEHDSARWKAWWSETPSAAKKAGRK